MLRILNPVKDSYITNRIIKSVSAVSGNVGDASSIDLFKLYGMTEDVNNQPNTELSRGLIKFDLDPLRALVASNKIDITNRTFKCYLKLFDVDGGQTCPTNYTLVINPLSRSFEEGLGRDIVTYADVDTCNWLSSSTGTGWVSPGCSSGGLATGVVDYITDAVINSVTQSLGSYQTFVKGTEDLEVDVTDMVAATLRGDIPDEGFRITYSQENESDTQTYFVKRFASRNAFDESYHPQLKVQFDDSIQDDSLNLVFDEDNTIFLYNYNRGTYSNLISNNVQVTGSNSLLLRLSIDTSGGYYHQYFTGSQYLVGGNPSLPVSGIYSASFNVLSSNPMLVSPLETSGSIVFNTAWLSLDGNTVYHSGDKLRMNRSRRGGKNAQSSNLIVSVTGLTDTIDPKTDLSVRVNIVVKDDPNIMWKKTPAILPGAVIRDVHYRIRDAFSEEVVVEFDTVNNSTRVSSDNSGMYFSFNTENLSSERSYVIDILVNENESHHISLSASPIFRVGKLR